MQQYHDLLTKIMNEGDLSDDRTGVGTRSLFMETLRFDLSKGFPAMTTKKLAMHSVVHELLWFLSGSRNIRYLVQNNVKIWNEWPYKAYLVANDQPVPSSDSSEWKQGIKQFAERIKEDDVFAERYGDLGPVYGYQWRHWPDGHGGEVDQIARAVEMIKTTPNSRRIIVSAWNVADIDEMTIAGLPPCHLLFQFHVANGRLNCHLTQRSADVFLGVPFNIASYALLTSMMAQVTGLKPGVFAMSMTDAHIYRNHEEQVTEQLARTPRELPTLVLNPAIDSIFDFRAEDIRLKDYNPAPSISAPIAV